MLQLKDADERRLAIRDIAIDLAATDPARARQLVTQWLASNNNLGRGDAVVFLETFGGAYARRDSAAAAAWTKFLTGELRELALGPVMRHWVTSDMAAALNWFEGLAEVPMRSGLIRVMGQALDAAGTVEEGRKWAAHFAGSLDGGRNADVVARVWTRADPEGAFRWAGGLADAGEQGAALMAIAGALAESNPAGAGDWVARFPEGIIRERAILNTATTWAGRDPAAAAAWIEGMGSRQALESAFHVVARSWLERDPAGANAWITRVRVPDSVKEYVRRF